MGGRGRESNAIGALSSKAVDGGLSLLLLSSWEETQALCYQAGGGRLSPPIVLVFGRIAGLVGGAERWRKAFSGWACSDRVEKELGFGFRPGVCDSCDPRIKATEAGQGGWGVCLMLSRFSGFLCF